MTFLELVKKLELFNVGTNRADLCWEMKEPLPDEELDILNQNAEKLELELDETELRWLARQKTFSHQEDLSYFIYL